MFFYIVGSYIPVLDTDVTPCTMLQVQLLETIYTLHFQNGKRKQVQDTLDTQTIFFSYVGSSVLLK